jgi:hypothetical protein
MLPIYYHHQGLYLIKDRIYIRKKATLTLYKLFLQYPDALRQTFLRLKENLKDNNHCKFIFKESCCIKYSKCYLRVSKRKPKKLFEFSTNII